MTSIMFKTRLAALTAVLGASLLTACSSYNSVTGKIADHITPYRVTIVQGNFVSREAAAKLQVGMSRDAVRTALGTPLLVDMFHPERWDYIFYFKRGSTAVVEQRNLVINFQGDTVTSWTGAENLPSEQDLIAMIDGDRRERSLITQKRLSKVDAAQAKAEDTAGNAPAPAAPAPASGVVAPNQQAARAANAAMVTPVATPAARSRNVPQSAVVHGGPQSAVQAAPEPQFHFTTGNHLRPAGGDSLLARPPSADSVAPASGTSATGATE